MFSELGWLDNDYNFDNVTAEADALSLPENVSRDVLFEFHLEFWNTISIGIPVRRLATMR